MGRYRPPAVKKSPYITRDGFDALKQEEAALWKKRREVVVHVTAAAAEGDRSENAEYIYRKKQLRELDRRIRYLQKRIPELKVVDAVPDTSDRVFFGAWVTLADQSGTEITYRIVGADEFDPKQNWISVDSPMAKALMKRTIDESIEVSLPKGDACFDIVGICYIPTV